jgi:hypothetical protein
MNKGNPAAGRIVRAFGDYCGDNGRLDSHKRLSSIGTTECLVWIHYNDCKYILIGSVHNFFRDFLLNSGMRKFVFFILLGNGKVANDPERYTTFMPNPPAALEKQSVHVCSMPKLAGVQFI